MRTITNRKQYRGLVVICLLIIVSFDTIGQTLIEVGKWYSINNTGDSILHEFTPDGQHILILPGQFVPLEQVDDPSAQPSSKLTHRYEVDYSTNPFSIDLYADDDSTRITSKGIFEMTSDNMMRICIDRFGWDRPTEFVPLDNRRDTQVLIRLSPKGL